MGAILTHRTTSVTDGADSNSLFGLDGNFTFFQNQLFASGFQEVEVVDEKIWVLGGDGFGTERARLAQGGFRGQFYKRNPLKRIF